MMALISATFIASLARMDGESGLRIKVVRYIGPFINLGNPGVTRMDAWYQAPSHMQTSHVYKIVDVLNNNGMRCNRPGVTVGYIRSELMTRANAGKYQPSDKLFDRTVEVLKDACGI